jgi:Fe2+ transport system protein FeoA
MAVGIAFAGGEELGIALALAILAHDVPEGLAVALPMRSMGMGLRRTTFRTTVTGLIEVACALLAHARGTFLARGPRGADRREARERDARPPTATRSRPPSSRSTSRRRGRAGRTRRRRPRRAPPCRPADPALLRHVDERGLRIGAPFVLVDRQPFGGPLTLRIGGGEQVVSERVARALRVALDP